MAEGLTKDDLEKVNSIKFEDVNTTNDLDQGKDSNEESVNDRATRSIMGNIDLGEIERTHAQIEEIFSRVVEKYINPYYEIVDICKTYRRAAKDIGIASEFKAFDEVEMKRKMDELTGSMDLIKAKSDEILENVQGLDIFGKEYKGSTKIPLEETRKLNEAFALTADLATIAGKMENCMQNDDKGISPISELYEKQISGVKTTFISELNEKITNLIADSKILNLKEKTKLVLDEKVSLIERVMGKHKLKAAQVLNYTLLKEKADVLRNEDLGARNIGESIVKLYNYVASIPDSRCTEGLHSLIKHLSESAACQRLLKQAKMEKAKRMEEKRQRYERGEVVDFEEPDQIIEERPQKVLEKEFAENSLVVVSRNEKFFKPYRKETEKLQGENAKLKREIDNLKSIFNKHKKDTKDFIRETVNGENQAIIISRLEEVISCLYSETPNRKREKTSQMKEETER